jgi:catechol 2,3-dioxygenase-like lactoylglutathione lyase family enzyme
MKRFHVNVSVANLGQSIEFYNTLFGQEPSVRKDDYAKWMLDDPRLNFAISQSSRSSGINHIGLQADTMDELAQIQARLAAAGEQTFEQPAAECCYARSSKTWVQDPDSVRWETFVTHGQITHYGADDAPGDARVEAARCCA